MKPCFADIVRRGQENFTELTTEKLLAHIRYLEKAIRGLEVKKARLTNEYELRFVDRD